MEVWADINIVFGSWPPSEMNTMTLEELMDWHEIAIERNRQQEEAAKR